MFLMFLEKKSMITFLISGCWLNSDGDLGVRNWVLIEIVAFVDLNDESFFMAEILMGLLLRLITEFFEADKLSFRETDIIARGWWSDGTAV